MSEGTSVSGLDSAFRELRFSVFYNNNGFFVSGWFPPMTNKDPSDPEELLPLY